MGLSVHVLPGLHDEARVRDDQILGEGRNRAGGRIMEGPGTGFPETDEIIVRGDLDEEKPVHEDGFDLGNTHRCALFQCFLKDGSSAPVSRPAPAATSALGRAASEERVCQDVLISVAAVSLKKKNS